MNQDHYKLNFIKDKKIFDNEKEIITKPVVNNSLNSDIKSKDRKINNKSSTNTKSDKDKLSKTQIINKTKTFEYKKDNKITSSN